MDYQCQLTFLNGQGCQLPAFRDTDLCFWHAVWHRIRWHYRNIPTPIVRSLQLLAIGLFLMAGYGLWRGLRTGEIIWLLLSIFAFGAALRLFSDSIMGLAQPLSQLGVWPYLLALGLALEVIAGVVTAVTLMVSPQTGQPLVDLSNNDQWRFIIAQGSLVVVLGIAVSLELTAFQWKILGTQPRGTGLVWLLVCVGLLNIFAPDFFSNPFQSRIIKKEFWEAAIGSYVEFVMSLTCVISVSVVTVKGESILNRRLHLHDHQISDEARTQSFRAYYLVPLLAMAATRYLMVWTGLNGFFFFIPSSVAMAFAFCILIIRWSVRRALWREALAEGEDVPVIINADYEFSSDWTRLVKDFGRASRRLRAATYELVRRADPDPSIDRLSTFDRTQLMVEETKRAFKIERNTGLSLDISAKNKLFESLKKLESDVSGAEEEVAKWREQVRCLEGEGEDKLPAGISNLLPVPDTVDEKIQIKKARILQIKRTLELPL